MAATTRSAARTTGGPRRRIVPPDPGAVRAALEPPARPKTGARNARALGVLAIFALLATFWLPRKTPTTAAASGETFGTSVSHDRGLRVRVPLRKETVGERTTAFEGVLLFRYAAVDEDFDAAQAAIRERWDDAKVHLGRVLREYTRRDVVESLDEINARLPGELSAQLFPALRGRVTQVGWQWMKLR